MMKTIEVRDRIVRNITIGVEGDNLVEQVAFTGLPVLAEDQTVALRWAISPTIGDIIYLPLTAEGYIWTIDNSITQHGDVNISAYIMVLSGVKKWSTFSFSIRNYELPDTQATSIFTPTIIDQMLMAIQEHLSNMGTELTAAQTARTGSETAQSASEAAAGIATSKATEASTKASDASGSASSALASENAAANSASSANTSAGIATTKASEASTSASEALSSKNAAATSADEALNSKNAAAASEANASSSEQASEAAKSGVESLKADLDATYEKVVLHEVLDGGEVIVDAETVEGFKAGVTAEIEEFTTDISTQLAAIASEFTIMIIDGGEFTDTLNYKTFEGGEF